MDLRGECLTQRAVGIWNELPEEVMLAEIVTTFQKHLDSYLNEQNMEGYGINIQT